MLGLILLVAAGLKAHQLASDPFVTLAHRSPLPSGEGWLRALTPAFLHPRPFLIAVVECELLLGLVLLSGILPRLTWALALLCFGGFAIVSLYKGISGESTCGCFGRVPVNPWYTFALDGAAVLALMRWRPRGLAASHVNTIPRFATIAALWLVVGTPVALATWSEPVGTPTDLGELLPDGKTVLLKPEAWVGKGFALADHIDVGKKFLEGAWLVLLYDHTCPACRDAVAQYRGLAEEFSKRSRCPAIALVECPPYGENEDSAADVRWTQGYLDTERRWKVSTPLGVLVHDGKVQGVFEDPRDVELVRAIWGNEGQP
jgi:hypothetical protein